MEHLISLSTSHFLSAGSTREKRLCFQTASPHEFASPQHVDNLANRLERDEEIPDATRKEITSVSEHLGKSGDAAVKILHQHLQDAQNARDAADAVLKTEREQHNKDIKELRADRGNSPWTHFDVFTQQRLVASATALHEQYLNRLHELSQVPQAERTHNHLAHMQALTQWLDDVAQVDSAHFFNIDGFHSDNVDQRNEYRSHNATAHEQFLKGTVFKGMVEIDRLRKVANAPGATPADRAALEAAQKVARATLDGRITDLYSADTSPVYGVNWFVHNVGAPYYGTGYALREIFDNVRELQDLRRQVDGLSPTPADAKTDKPDAKAKGSDGKDGAKEKGKTIDKGSDAGTSKGDGKKTEVKEDKEKEIKTFFQELIKFLREILIVLGTINDTLPRGAEEVRSRIDELTGRRTTLQLRLLELRSDRALATDPEMRTKLDKEITEVQTQISNLTNEITRLMRIDELNKRGYPHHLRFGCDNANRILVQPIGMAGMIPFNQFMGMPGVQGFNGLNCQFINPQLACFPPAQLPAMQQVMNTGFGAPGYGAFYPPTFTNQVQVVVGNPGPAGSKGTKPAGV